MTPPPIDIEPCAACSKPLHLADAHSDACGQVHPECCTDSDCTKDPLPRTIAEEVRRFVVDFGSPVTALVIAEDLRYSPFTVNKALRTLHDRGLVETVAHGIYTPVRAS